MLRASCSPATRSSAQRTAATPSFSWTWDNELKGRGIRGNTITPAYQTHVRSGAGRRAVGRRERPGDVQCFVVSCAAGSSDTPSGVLPWEGEFVAMGIFQRLFGSSFAAQRSAPTQQDEQACPICGSSRLVAQQRESRAEWRLDAESSLAVNFTVTQINCAACDKLINDDVNGTTSAAYEKLVTEAGAPDPQISAKVHNVMQHAEQLSVQSDSERQQYYDQACQSWGCLGMRHVSADKLQDALTRIIHGYFAEGATQCQVETLEQQIVQLSFFTSGGFRPVRFSRAADGSFSFFGQVPLYRFLEDRKPTLGKLRARAAASSSVASGTKDQAESLEATHPVFRLKAGMDKGTVVGLLGRNYRSTKARRELLEYQAQCGPMNAVHIIDASILENEYWLYLDQGHYIEIIFQSGSLASAEVKKKNADRSETLLVRIDQDGLAAVKSYRTALGAKKL
jgi:hypothetical protein